MKPTTLPNVTFSIAAFRPVRLPLVWRNYAGETPPPQSSP
jgi:hypothetical protein